MENEKMVERFVCPGCVAGSDTNCGRYTPLDFAGGCSAHVCGTGIIGVGNMALGMPRGFQWCRRASYHESERDNTMLIRCWTAGTTPDWDAFNIAIWAMEQDGFLFVTTAMPRTKRYAVDIIEGGTLTMVPGAIDVSTLDVE